MAKKLSAYRLEEEVISKLKALAKKNNRSAANMIEVLVEEADKKEAKKSPK